MFTDNHPSSLYFPAQVRTKRLQTALIFKSDEIEGRASGKRGDEEQGRGGS